MSSKLLVKIFLVFNLIFSGMAVWIATSVFQDREVVKARTVLLRENINKAAENLAYSEKQPWESSAQNESAFRMPDVDSGENLPDLVDALDSLETLAVTRTEQLAETYEQVQVTKAELETAQSKQGTTGAELASIRTEIENLETQLEETQEKVQVARNDYTEIEGENTRLQNEIQDLSKRSGDLQEQVSETRENLNMRTIERDRLQELLAACRRPRTEDGDSGDWHQKTARILAADPDWEYVVINKGEVDVLPMYLEAFVHRGDEYIAKIRVFQVEDTVSIAEVIPNTMKPGTEIQSGDTLFF